MNGTYSPGLVLLSVMIAVFASYVALDLANSITAARGRARLAWLTGGSLAMGTGIWSMHFVGMLALRMPGMAIAYNLPLLFLSVSIAVGASALALFAVSRPVTSLLMNAGAAIAMGAAIAGMHYTGMWSMRMQGSIEWSLALVAASIGIALGASFVALWMAVRFRMDSTRRGRRMRLAGSAVMGLAIVGMHYTAMAAARFVPGAGALAIGSEDLLATRGLAVAVTGTTVLVLAIAVAGSVVSREMARRSVASQEIEHLRAQAQLSLDEYRLLFDDNPHPMWVYDPETLAFLAVNETSVRDFGYSREEFLTKTLWDLHSAEEHPLLLRSAERIAGVETVARTRIHKKNGSVMDAEVDARSTAYAGKPARIALIHDITEQVRAEEALRESERRLSILIGNLPGVVYRSRNDPRWTMEYCGGGVEELLGYTSGQMTGEGAVSLADQIHPEDRQRVWEAVQAAVRAREPFQLEYRIRTAAGREKWVWEQGVGIFSDEGDLRALEGFITDVTLMKRAEEEHRRLLLEQAARVDADMAQQRIRDILESISDAFFALDEHGVFSYVNAAAERVFRRSRDELLGSSLWEQFPDTVGSIFEEKVREVLTAQRPVEFEAYYPPLQAWLEVRGYPAAEGLVVYLRDITRRKQAQEILRRSEERFRSLTEHSSDLITVLDADGRIRYESASLERVLGYTPDDLLGRSAFELVHPDDLPSVVAAFQRLMEEPGQTQTVEFRFRHRNGEWRDLESVAINRLQDSAVEGVVVNSRDITARSQSQERLRESEERFRQMAESVREVFWMRDESLSQILYLSPAYEEVWGRSPEEVRARPDTWMDAISEEDRAQVAAAFTPERVRSGGVDAEYRIVRPDGEVRWIHDRAFPVRDADGGVYRIAGIAEDITDRKYIEEALQRSQDALEAMLHASPDIVEIVSLEGRVEWASPAMHTVLGYEPVEVRGRPMLDLVHPEDRESTRTSLGELARGTREEMRQRYRAHHAHGHWVALEASGRMMVRDGEPSLMIVARDVTEQVRLENASREAKLQAERANQAKSEFLGRMSHELRTPLNAILGFAQILEMDVAGDEDRESVEQILRAGQHLLGLVNEVLDLSRIEAGEMGLSVEPVAVREAVSQSVELVRHMAAQQGITLSADRALETSAFVAADLQRLKQVLLNLLSNAIKYNRPGGSVTLSCVEMAEDRLRIVVQDTGYGIAAEKMERLFVPFERLSAEGSGVEGTGLGLALSRGLMEAMGGTLGVESREGRGSGFWAELPIVTVTGDAASQADPAPATPMVETPGEQTHVVLLIEDNLTNVRLMERVFRRRPQVRLVVAMQGSVGLDLAREHHPGLILLDLNLPDLSGREVLRRLRADPALRDVPVVMVSGDAMPEQVERVKAAGAHGYITKPFDVAELLQLVDDILEVS